jgi:hypothetical protein
MSVVNVAKMLSQKVENKNDSMPQVRGSTCSHRESGEQLLTGEEGATERGPCHTKVFYPLAFTLVSLYEAEPV